MRLLWTTLLVTAALSVASCAVGLRPAAPTVTPSGVRFTFERPDAHSVAVAGSFNDWSVSSHPLTRERTRGLWSGIVVLPPGEHLFMYVVDGTEWVSPPLAQDLVDDGFGAKNGIVVVGPTDR
jgi:1,4-alpha-glucan branching enzyme